MKLPVNAPEQDSTQNKIKFKKNPKTNKTKKPTPNLFSLLIEHLSAKTDITPLDSS